MMIELEWDGRLGTPTTTSLAFRLSLVAFAFVIISAAVVFVLHISFLFATRLLIRQGRSGPSSQTPLIALIPT